MTISEGFFAKKTFHFLVNIFLEMFVGLKSTFYYANRLHLV